MTARISKASKSDFSSIPITATAMLMLANLVSCMLIEFGTEASQLTHASHHVSCFCVFYVGFQKKHSEFDFTYSVTELASFKASSPFAALNAKLAIKLFMHYSMTIL